MGPHTGAGAGAVLLLAVVSVMMTIDHDDDGPWWPLGDDPSPWPPKSVAIVVQLHIRSGSHIHGRKQPAKGIESMMLLMLMRTLRRRTTPQVVVVLNRSPNGLLFPAVVVVEPLGIEESSGWNKTTSHYDVMARGDFATLRN